MTGRGRVSGNGRCQNGRACRWCSRNGIAPPRIYRSVEKRIVQRICFRRVPLRGPVVFRGGGPGGRVHLLRLVTGNRGRGSWFHRSNRKATGCCIAVPVGPGGIETWVVFFQCPGLNPGRLMAPGWR